MSNTLHNQGKLDFSHMRDIQELRKVGVDLSTSSNEVAKLWDAITFQSFGFFDSPELNGIQGSVSKILNLDPECPLIRIIKFDIGDENFDSMLSQLKTDLRIQHNNEKQLARKWTEFEKDQVQTCIYRLEGYDDLAADASLRQLAKYPLDMMTLKSTLPLFILKGWSEQIAPLVGHSTQVMNRSSIYYPFIRGYEAYGLEERGQLDLAMRIAEESIEMCPWNAWAIHSVAHIYDAQGRPADGLTFMNRTRNDWAPCNWLSTHNSWHMCLFHLDNFNVGEALEIYDSDIMPQVKERFNYFKMSDAVSVLSRIEFEERSITNNNKEFNLTSRWNDLFEFIVDSTEIEMGYSFYDAHLALAMMGSRHPDLLKQIRDRIQNWLIKYQNRVFEEWESNTYTDLFTAGFIKSNRYVTKSRTLLPLVSAMIFFDDGDYQSAVNVLFPIRNELQNLGGSKAQRDVFVQLLATCLLMAGGETNSGLLNMLLLERHDQRVNDDYSDRMQKRIIDYH